MPDFLAADGTRIVFSDEGSGRPILCLAGLTRDARDFDYLLPHLSGYRVIRPDYRGRGRSDFADPRSYTLQQEAADQLALLDHLDLADVAIIGTSRGGLIGFLLAMTGRERLTGLCLNDVGPVLDPVGLMKIAGYIGLPPQQKTRADYAAALPLMKPEFIGVPAKRWAQEAERHVVETEDGLGLTYDPRLRQTVLPSLALPPNPAVWVMFESLRGLPLCLLRGENSDLLSPLIATEMRRRRPDMLYSEVAGRGHIPFLDEPESLAAIRDWLELLP